MEGFPMGLVIGQGIGSSSCTSCKDCKKVVEVCDKPPVVYEGISPAILLISIILAAIMGYVAAKIT